MIPTGLARLPVDGDEIQETKPKWWTYTCIVLGFRSCVNSSNFTYKANLHTPKVEIHTRQKLCHFGCCVAKAKLFCLKSFVPVTRAGVFIWENFHPGYRDLVRKNRDLGNRASPASHTNTSNFLLRKEWRGRDLGNRAIPVNRADMKRPSVFWVSPGIPTVWAIWNTCAWHVNGIVIFGSLCSQ